MALSQDSEAVHLSTHEAVVLGYPLVDRVARMCGVRALAIKGPVTDSYALRPARPSIDVDYLVDPAEFDALLVTLNNVGWHEHVNSSVDLMPYHSVTMRHAAWPIELDLHHYFPGFLERPDAVFEELWIRRAQVGIGGVEVQAAGKVPMAAIAGLHLLRDQARRRFELDSLASRISSTFTASEVADLLDLAHKTGALETLTPLLELLGATSLEGNPARAGLDAWNLRASAPSIPSIAWVNAFSNQPLREWPRLLRRALMLTETEIREIYPDLGDGSLGLWRGRARRWLRGAKGLRAARGALKSDRRSHK